MTEPTIPAHRQAIYDDLLTIITALGADEPDLPEAKAELFRTAVYEESEPAWLRLASEIGFEVAGLRKELAVGNVLEASIPMVESLIEPHDRLHDNVRTALLAEMQNASPLVRAFGMALLAD